MKKIKINRAGFHTMMLATSLAHLENEVAYIYIDDDILLKTGEYIKEIYDHKDVYIITDETVDKLYNQDIKDTLKDFNIHTVIIPGIENSKCLNTFQRVAEELLNEGISRDCLIIAIGGGVVIDIAGFVASVLYRGIEYVTIPTTLLSQVDGAVGGKTGVNFLGRKNAIGSFYPPLLTLIDPKVLDSLSKEDYTNGKVELVKHGIIESKKLLKMLEEFEKINTNIIYESLKVKKKYVEHDPSDRAERMVLNFGQSFAHIIELEKNIKHGCAVAYGMLMETKLSMDLGYCSKEVYDKIEKLLAMHGLDTTYHDYKKYLMKFIDSKKTANGILDVVLIKDINKFCIQHIPVTELEKLR